MIKQAEFHPKMQELGLLLTGKRIPKEFGDAVYDKVSRWFAMDDFSKACDSMLADGIGKLTYPILYKHLINHRTNRLEREAVQAKAGFKGLVENFHKSLPQYEEIMEAALCGNKQLLEERYGISEKTFPPCNGVLIRKDGTRQRININAERAADDGTVTSEYQDGPDGVRRCLTLDTREGIFTILGGQDARDDVEYIEEVVEHDDLEEFDL